MNIMNIFRNIGLEADKDKRIWAILACVVILTTGMLYFGFTKECLILECAFDFQGMRMPTSCEYIREHKQELKNRMIVYWNQTGGNQVPLTFPTTTIGIQHYECPDCPVCEFKTQACPTVVTQTCPSTTAYIEVSTVITYPPTTTTEPSITDYPYNAYSPKIPMHMRRCFSVDECTTINETCCPCGSFGGRVEAINIGYAQTWRTKLNCSRIYCDMRKTTECVYGVACVPKYASGKYLGNYCVTKH